MKLEVQIDKRANSDFVGELLLHLINPKERWGYWTHDMNSDWIESNEDPENFDLDIKTLCCGCEAKTPQAYKAIQKYHNSNLNLDVYLYWDGDGTMVFHHLKDNWLLYNNDCKKPNEWEWVDEDSWLKGYWD